MQKISFPKLTSSTIKLPKEKDLTMKKAFMFQTIFTYEDIRRQYPVLTIPETQQVLEGMKQIVEDTRDEYCYKIMHKLPKKASKGYYK